MLVLPGKYCPDSSISPVRFSCLYTWNIHHYTLFPSAIHCYSISWLTCLWSLEHGDHIFSYYTMKMFQNVHGKNQVKRYLFGELALCLPALPTPHMGASWTLPVPLPPNAAGKQWDWSWLSGPRRPCGRPRWNSWLHFAKPQLLWPSGEWTSREAVSPLCVYNCFSNKHIFKKVFILVQ